MQAELRKEIESLKTKVEERDKWLSEHYNHPDRHKIRSDRNALAVRLETAKYKLANMQTFKPQLGFGEGMPDHTIEHRKTQSKQ